MTDEWLVIDVPSHAVLPADRRPGWVKTQARPRRSGEDAGTMAEPVRTLLLFPPEFMARYREASL